MMVKIEERRDYELYVKHTVAKLQISNKQKATFRKIALQCFDDGVRYSRDDLEVEVVE